MDKILVQGGITLRGEVDVSGAKNAALPILFSCLLAEGEHVFYNMPRLKDVESAAQLLELLGCKTRWEGDVFFVQVAPPTSLMAHYDVVRKMRASFLCLGPLLARYHEATVSLPGGCAIGARPIQLHLDALKSLGADIEVKEGNAYVRAQKLVGSTFLFETSTVGGTENLLMAAALAEGVTIIENAAKEPEVVDLALYLNKMGAKISGAGSSIIRIEGVKELKPSSHSIMPDRIEAGTLLLAGAITGGEVRVKGCDPKLYDSLIFKLSEAGFSFIQDENSILVKSQKEWCGVDITTAPYPFFPTDLQAQYMALMTIANGTSVITETVFENRFMHVQELVRLGADITPKARVAVVRGKRHGLKGAPVMATDLRASASLVLAGLAASSETSISRVYHLDRGYDRLVEKLQGLGARIKRVA